MDEQNFRHALRGAMNDTPTPPPMHADDVLDAAKRAERKRKALWAGGGSAAAVTLIAAAAVVLTANGVGSDTVNPAAGPSIQPTSTAQVTSSAPAPTSVQVTQEPPKDTEPVFPDGQTDRTATSGPQADKSAALLDVLAAAIPAGMTAPVDLKPVTDELHGPLRNHQSQVSDNEGKVWEYQAMLPVGVNGKWGKLLIEVHPGGSPLEDCELTKSFWGMGGKCGPVVVNGTTVGVVTQPARESGLDQWTAYKHPDGTVVFLAQAASYAYTGLPGLDALPLTVDQLAALATDPKFLVK
ncbi:hypothetical protein [Actinokineospora iranica]|uniref:Uncharacterized protein n=1 Tax=Actinokineospora iranica TaxID=1271860 RepID=A0A1G6QL04_9PSEU|nr:hypothetical protein [Actinokineospora iranica]SDC92347.1 hypothetical protein SAMN05216174_105325 [Actinokineospora iranica]